MNVMHWKKPLMFAALWIFSLFLVYVVALSRNSSTKRSNDTDIDHIVNRKRAVNLPAGKVPQPDRVALKEKELKGKAENLVTMEDLQPALPEISPDSSPPVDFAEDAITEAVVAPLGAEEIRTYLGPALLSSDLVSRNLTIAHMLSRLTRENVGEMLRVFESTPRSFHSDQNYELFLHAWAKIDGEAAMDYIRNNPNAYRANHGQVWAMSGWAQIDPEAALNYVQAQDRIDHGLYHGLIRGWARVDLDAASAYVEGIEEGGVRYRLAYVLGESYMEQNGVSGSLDWAVEVAETSEDPAFARAALENVIKRGGSQDAAVVAEWIDANPDNPYIKSWMYEHIAGNLADRDPQLAAEWVLSHMDNKQVSGRAVSRVAGEWAERDPATAADWVDSLRGTEVFTKEVVDRLAGTWAVVDPNAAFEWADRLDPDLRRSAYGTIVGRMPKEGLEAVGTWVRGTPAESVMDGARAAYAWRTINDNPSGALEQAALMTDAQGRERVTVGIAEKMYYRDPEGTRAWLPNSGLSEAAQQRVLRGRKRGK